MTRVAAIDCGTNSIRLLVADPTDDGRLVDVVRRMEIVRLGEGVDRTGSLAPAALERTRTALADYAAELRRLGVDARDGRVRMVATSATRDAANRADFTAMVTATLGVPPEVITGAEEAALSFTGAVHDVDPALAPPYLVADIGGGSTELVLGTRIGVTAARSVDIGCVRLTERHLHTDPPTPAEIAAAESDVRAAVAIARDTVPVADARTLVGVAGSVTTVAALALGLPDYRPAEIHGARIAYADVARITAMVLSATRAERAALGPMHPGRIDVIGGGALVLRVVMAEIGADSVVASEHDILDGIALALR